MESIRARGKKYILKKSLGKGASGEVYLAYDSFFDPLQQRAFSLKFLRSGMLNPDYRKFYYDLSKFSHPGVQRFLGFEVWSKRILQKFDFVDGVDLYKLMNSNIRLDAYHLVSWTYGVMNSLFGLNAAGLFHGDISLSNIILNESSEPILIDLEPRPDFGNNLDRSGVISKGIHHDLNCLLYCIKELAIRKKVFDKSPEFKNWLEKLQDDIHELNYEKLKLESSENIFFPCVNELLNEMNLNIQSDNQTPSLKVLDSKMNISLFAAMTAGILVFVFPDVTNIF